MKVNKYNKQNLTLRKLVTIIYTSLVILTSDKLTFKTRTIARDKEGYLKIAKNSIYQEDIPIHTYMHLIIKFQTIWSKMYRPKGSGRKRNWWINGEKLLRLEKISTTILFSFIQLLILEHYMQQLQITHSSRSTRSIHKNKLYAEL